MWRQVYTTEMSRLIAHSSYVQRQFSLYTEASNSLRWYDVVKCGVTSKVGKRVIQGPRYRQYTIQEGLAVASIARDIVV